MHLPSNRTRGHAPLLALALLLALLAVAAPAAAQGPAGPAEAAPAPGAEASIGQRLNPDGSLNTDGFSGSLDTAGYTMTLGPDGEPLFAPQAELSEAELAAAGDSAWDDRFGAPGLNGQLVNAAAVTAAGDLIVGGYFTNLPGLPDVGAIARWDGRRWHALGQGLGGVGPSVRQIATAGNTVYVVGNFESAGGASAIDLARWDGTRWSAVGGGAGVKLRSEFFTDDGEIYTVAVGPNGHLYIGGHFNRVDGVSATGVAHWDGARWNALGEGLGERAGWEGAERTPGTVYALAFGPDGSLYAGGRFNEAGAAQARAIARWNGGAWSALGDGLEIDNGFVEAGHVQAIAVSGTTVYAGGRFNRAGGQPALNVARWSGGAWSALGAGLGPESPDQPAVLSLLIDGATLVAGGRFTSAGGQAAAGIARWNGSQWQTIGEPLKAMSENARVEALAPAPGGFYALGAIAEAGPRQVYNIVRWDGQRWVNLGDGVSGLTAMPEQIYAVAVDGKGRVYVGGRIAYVGGLPVRNLAMWDGTRWHDVGGGIGGSAGPHVYDLLTVGDDLYVAGSFTEVGGLPAVNVAKWSGATRKWSALGAGIPGLMVNALAYGDGMLFAGGTFDFAGGAEAKDVAIWDGQSWSGLGGDYEIFEIGNNGGEVATYVNALTYYQGELFIGGRFQTIHERAASSQDLSSYLVVHNLVSYVPATEKWLVAGSLAKPGVTFQGGSGWGIEVNALAVAGGDLFVGGTFSEAGGLPAANLARFDLGTGGWSAAGNIGGVEEPAVHALTFYGGYLYVGGAFTGVGASPARFAARYNLAAGTWEALGSGMRWYNDKFTNVQAIAASGGGVYLGGEFDYAGPHPSVGFARWGGPQGTPELTPAQGGGIQAADGTRLTAPAGAVAQPTDLSYQAFSGSPNGAPAGMLALRSFRISAQTMTGQPVVSFSKPATLRVPYTAAQAKAVKDSSSITLMAWDGSRWQPLMPCAGCSVDTVNRVITVQTTRTGTFAVVGASANVLYLPLLRR